MTPSRELKIALLPEGVPTMPLHCAPRWRPVPGRPPSVPSSQGKAFPETGQQQGENSRHLGALLLLTPKEWHAIPCLLKDPLSRPLPQARSAGMEGRATKGSWRSQLPMELLALGQHIHLANFSVLSQRLRSPSCEVRSGKTEQAQGRAWEKVGRGARASGCRGNHSLRSTVCDRATCLSLVSCDRDKQ